MKHLIQLLCDPENQPHQFVGDPDELRKAMTPPTPPSSMPAAAPTMPLPTDPRPTTYKELSEVYDALRFLCEQQEGELDKIIEVCRLKVEFDRYTWDFHGVRYKRLSAAVKARLEAASKESDDKA